MIAEAGMIEEYWEVGVGGVDADVDVDVLRKRDVNLEKATEEKADIVSYC